MWIRSNHQYWYVVSSEGIVFFESWLQFLQGADDHIVPPRQSYGMYEAIIKKSGTAEYKEYPGEGHGGWTKSADIKDALDRELAWYKKVLKLK
jgi:dipeptidyl aminopeptidase/acylaminoacyl peptidase